MQRSVVQNPDLIGTLQHYADLFTFAPVGCVVLCEDSRVDDANRVAAAMLGWPRSWVVGQLFSRWVVKGDLPRFLEHLRSACRSEQSVSGEFRIKDRRGRVRDVRFDSAAMVPRGEARSGGVRAHFPLKRCQLIITDITEQRWAAREPRPVPDELAHAARLNSCGEMAAALAHELNQPLGAIALYCNATIKSLRSGAVEPDRLAETLEKVAEAATHASGTIRGLRGFLRKGESTVEPLALNDVLRAGARMATAYAKDRGCRIELRLGDALPPVKVNRTHLQQVLLNLLQNSIDAMQESGCADRRIAITTERVDDALRVTVADTGPGMTPQQRRRAFEPFYTTKKDGMGIGLPISRSIVESYGGSLWAVDGLRRGTALSFTLPIHDEHHRPTSTTDG